jgi:hypothetical protein
MRVRNLEGVLKEEIAALRHENTESVEQCKRITLTCIDIMNKNLWEVEESNAGD